MDTKFILRVIDYYCSFQYLLQYRSSDYIELSPYSYTPGASVYCPFHENTDTKAAKVYGKKEGDDPDSESERLYCFAENKLYFPHSLLSPPKDKPNMTMFKSIVPYTPQWVFNAIWNNLPENEKDYWKAYSPTPITSSKPNTLYGMYREGNISLFSLLESLAKQE